MSFSDLQGQEQLTIVLGAIGLLWGYDFLLLGVPWWVWQGWVWGGVRLRVGGGEQGRLAQAEPVPFYY